MPRLKDILMQLSQEAGPRGFTYAGRAMQPGEDFAAALERFPQGEAEYGGLAMQSGDLLKTALMGGMIRPFTRPSFKKISTPSLETYENLKKANQTKATIDDLNKVLDAAAEVMPDQLDKLSLSLDLYASHIEKGISNLSLGGLWSAVRRAAKNVGNKELADEVIKKAGLIR